MSPTHPQSRRRGPLQRQPQHRTVPSIRQLHSPHRWANPNHHPVPTEKRGQSQQLWPLGPESRVNSDKNHKLRKHKTTGHWP